MTQTELGRAQPRRNVRRAVIGMLHRDGVRAQEWKTVYEGGSRKVEARGDEKRAIDANTGKIIIEYNF